MSRPLQIQVCGAVYHVMNRSTARQTIFVDEDDYPAFLNTLAEAHRLWGIDYFVLPVRNHYNLCLRTPKGNLSGSCIILTGIHPAVYQWS
jgi:putative transposase